MDSAFQYRGKSYMFSHVTGVVAGERETSEIRVSVSNKTIRTHTDKTQKVFVHDEETGLDTMVLVKDNPIAVIEGHRITAVAVRTGDTVAWVFIQNYSTGARHLLLDGMDFVRKFGSFLSSGCCSVIFLTVILAAAVFAAVAYLNIPSHAPWSGPLVLAQYGSGVVIFILLVIINNIRLKKIDRTYRQALDEYLRNLGL